MQAKVIGLKLVDILLIVSLNTLVRIEQKRGELVFNVLPMSVESLLKTAGKEILNAKVINLEVTKAGILVLTLE